MSATAFQRRRRITALQERCDELEIDYSEFGMDEIRYREAIAQAEQEPRDEGELEDKKVPELKAIAKGLNIEGADRMKKDELIAAIRAVGDGQ